MRTVQLGLSEDATAREAPKGMKPVCRARGSTGGPVRSLSARAWMVVVLFSRYRL